MGINDVDVRALRRFVAVAEARSFSRAAEHLRMAQPPLSRAIRDLEGDVGVPLFVRSTRSVELTIAGRVLFGEARGAIDRVEAAARRAARAGARVPRLVVAVKPGGNALFDAIVRRYEAEPNMPRVRAIVGGWGEQLAMLTDGRADVAFVRSPVDVSGIAYEVLFVEPRVAAPPRTHPLARRRSIRRGELASEPVPVWPPASPEIAAFRAGVESPAALARVPPGPPVHDLSQMHEAVALGQGVAFLPRSYAVRERRARLAFVPVSDIAPSKGGIAWLGTSTAVPTHHFVQAAVDVARAARAAERLA